MPSTSRLPMLLALASMLLSISNSQAQSEQKTRPHSDGIATGIDRVFQRFDGDDRPGAAVAVMQDGEIVFSKGYGSANLEYAIPVRANTVFHIASVSKQFTVFAVLLLEQDGKLSFDDDIRQYIPEVPDFGETITLRHLASHTSGLRDQWNLLAMAGWRLDDVITKEHVLELVKRQEELNFPPGERYLYCNTGFTLLAEVVARVSNRSFAEFTQDRIFGPLGMDRTLFYDDHQRIVKDRAYSYYRDSEDFKKSVLNYANVGATSLFTTVEDLSLWARNFDTPQVGNRALIEKMTELATLNDGETFGGAYGQFVGEFQGQVEVSHGGADAGYRSYFARYPELGLAVSVFSNFASANPNALAHAVASLYLPDPENAAEATVASPAKKRRYKRVSTKKLMEYEGHYWNEAEQYARELYLRADTLRYKRGEGNESALVPLGKGRFQMLDVPVDLVVTINDDAEGQGQMTVVIDGGEPILSRAFTPKTYSETELQAYAGEYYSPELDATYRIQVKEGRLVAHHTRLGDLAFSSFFEDRFTSESWYFQTIRFERNASDNISGFRISSGRVLNLWVRKVAP